MSSLRRGWLLTSDGLESSGSNTHDEDTVWSMGALQVAVDDDAGAEVSEFCIIICIYYLYYILPLLIVSFWLYFYP